MNICLLERLGVGEQHPSRYLDYFTGPAYYYMSRDPNWVLSLLRGFQQQARDGLLGRTIPVYDEVVNVIEEWEQA